MHNPLRSTTLPAAGDPGARRIPRGWWPLGLAVLLPVALLALMPGWWDATVYGGKRSLAAFLATYEEMYVLSAQEAGQAEYVVFVSDEQGREAWEPYFATAPGMRLEREGDLPGTLVVTLLGDPREGLERLRAQSFVQLAVRNRGALFCH